MPPWVVYTLIRVGLFAVLFAALWLLGLPWWIAAIVAAIAALCISYIALGGLRGRVATDLAARRAARSDRGDDERTEDAD